MYKKGALLQPVNTASNTECCKFWFIFKVETSPPSSGLSKNTLLEKTHKPSQDASEESKGKTNSVYTFTVSDETPTIKTIVEFLFTEICGFCRKPVILSEPAIEALNRTYHEACFQCRSCHIPLACKQYYNKAGIPLCEDCYQVQDIMKAANTNENSNNVTAFFIVISLK